MGVGPHWDTKSPCETEVGELEVVPAVDEKILRLEVTVEDAVRVAVEQARVKLVSEFLEERLETGVDFLDKRDIK